MPIPNYSDYGYYHPKFWVFYALKLRNKSSFLLFVTSTIRYFRAYTLSLGDYLRTFKTYSALSPTSREINVILRFYIKPFT